MNDKTQVYPKGLYTLAVVFVLSAIGVILFWAEWFRSGMHLNAAPEPYRIFENTFPLPDGVMALLMFATAVLLFRKSEYALFTGYFSAGMLLHLASLDTLYHLQHGNFSDWDDPETPQRIFISVYCYMLGLLTLAYLCWRRRAFETEHGRVPSVSGLPFELRAWVVMATVYGVSTAGFWMWWLQTGFDLPKEALVFYNAYMLADMASVSLCLFAAACIMQYPKHWALPAGIAGLAGLFFGCLGFAGFGAMNPELLGESKSVFWALVAFYTLYVFWGVRVLWRYRDMLL